MFLTMADRIPSPICFDANAGLFGTLPGPENVILSGAPNHVSIIDGIRLCRARRLHLTDGDTENPEGKRTEAGGARYRPIATEECFRWAALSPHCRPSATS